MATEIPLTQGQIAIVDDVDAVALSAWKWCACRQSRGRKFVAVRGDRSTGRKRLIYMHRQIMGLTAGDGMEADHLNHDTLDNRRENLRVVTPKQNKRYQPSRGGSSRFVGVTWDSTRRLWRAQISIDGKVTNLGRYPTEIEAAEARDAHVRGLGIEHKLNLASA